MSAYKVPGWDQIANEMRPKIRYWVPAAAMDVDDLRAELRELKERGFGGVEVVVLESALTPEMAHGEDAWGTENWDRMVQVIADTTAELGMTMDLANGPAWPISMPTVTSADDPAAICEMTWGVVECDGSYEGPLPERKRIRDEGTPVLVAAMAYRQRGEVLVKDSYVNLMSCIDGETLRCTLPKAPAGETWLLFCFWRQPSVHKVGSGKFYVVDHLSRAGVEACRAYWEPLLAKSDYPSLESFFCDSLEYQVDMEWTPGFEDEFLSRRGYDLLPLLPLIHTPDIFPEEQTPGYQADDAQLAAMVNRDYREVLTQLYCEYHLAGLEQMANDMGKTIRYQVAYNKPFEGERAALYVGVPENEALGRPSLDYLKLMAAAAHLGRKPRYSYECAAEFGHSYGQDYEDLFWWAKRGLMAGMNAQVLHGGSYSGAYHGKYSENGHLPHTRWPGHEGFGQFVSNYWNRTLSKADARGCMDALARLNTVFRHTAKVDCAIYRASYLNDGLGSEFVFYPDDGKLSNRGYSYEFVSPALLDLPVCRVTDGVLDAEGVGYRCLIVPPADSVSADFLRRAKALMADGFPVLWVGAKPTQDFYLADRSDADWQPLLDAVWAAAAHAESLDAVPDALAAMGILPRIRLEGDMDVTTAVRVDGDTTYCALYGYNRLRYPRTSDEPQGMSVSGIFGHGTIKESYQRPGLKSRRVINITLEGETGVIRCDPWTGESVKLEFVAENGLTSGQIALEEDELLILALVPAAEGEAHSGDRNAVAEYPVRFDTLTLSSFEPNTQEEISFLRSGFTAPQEAMALTALRPWRELDASLEQFGGSGSYEGRVVVPVVDPAHRYVLRLPRVSDTFRVWVNEVEAPFPDQVLNETELTGLLREGENTLRVVVTSNLYNKVVRPIDTPYFKLPTTPRDYGIWESDGEHCVVTELL